MRLKLALAITLGYALLVALVVNNTRTPAAASDIEPPAGWTAGEVQAFYHTSEGSEIFPTAWLQALQTPDGHRFLDAQNIARFGLLADPGQLPVGITSAETRDTRFLRQSMTGINCAACHVGEITHNGISYRIMGAPNLFSPQAYYGGIAEAGVAMIKDPRRFLGFLVRVRRLPGQPNPALDAPVAARSVVFAGALPQPVERIGAPDADGVFLEGLLARLKREVTTPSKDLANELLDFDRSQAARLHERLAKQVPDLESFSFLQGLSQWPKGPLAQTLERASERQAARAAFAKDAVVTFLLLKARVQLILRVASAGKGTEGGFGRVDAFGTARNLVFPKFAQQNPTTAPISYPHLWGLNDLLWLHWDANTNSLMERNLGQAIGVGAVFVSEEGKKPYSTLRVREIFRLEQLARRIPAPKWPVSLLGEVDPAAVLRGRQTYERDCAGCHDGPAAKEGSRLFSLEELGTDPNRAINFGRPVGDRGFADAIFAFLKGIKEQAYTDAGLTDAERTSFDGPLQPIEWRGTQQYPARSLAGVWATAPYLHNNSVPTLADLLSDNRPNQFWVGSREYNPGKVGLSTGRDPQRSFWFDTTKPGNSNSGHKGRVTIRGHEYRFGTDYEPSEREDLLAYLKQL